MNTVLTPTNKKDDLGSKPQKRPRPGRPSKQENSNSTKTSRNRLLEAAIEIFALFGYEAVSTGQISKRAGMSQSMVHYHFRTKERLWKAAIDHLMHDLNQRFPVARDELKDLDPVSQLKVMIRRFIKMSSTDIHLARIVTHEGTTPSARLKWFTNSYISPAFEEFDQAITEGIKLGLIKNLPVYAISHTLISAASFTFCISPMVKEVHGKDLTTPQTIDELSDTIMELIFSGVLK